MVEFRCFCAYELLHQTFHSFVFDILGLVPENNGKSEKLAAVMQLVIDMRADAKANKDWTTADKIRKDLNAAGIEIMDSKEGSSYKIN